MHRGNCARLVAAILGLVGSTVSSSANDGPFDEIRFGLFQHDTALIGHQKERGVDSAFEVLSHPLIDLPLIGSPRLVVGGVVNSEGQSDQAYVGFSGQWHLAHDVFRSSDSIFVEGTVGADWNDGKTDVRGTPLELHWKSHGSHFLIRSGVDVGYSLDETWSLAVSFNHISNAGLATPNEGMNDIGLRVGMKL